MKLLVVYNICGLSNKENTNYYISSIESILRQNFDNYKVVISSCLNSENTIKTLHDRFSYIRINWIKDKIPVNCSFNHTVLKSIEKYGEAEGYIYLDSGCHFLDQTNILQEMYNLYKSGPYGLVSIRTNTNTGFKDWFGIGNHDNDSFEFNKFFRSLNFHPVIPLGKAINLHCQLYSDDLVKFYGRPIVDVLAGEAHESVYSFVVAAIHKKWILNKELEIHHETSLDGPSLGFSPAKFVKETRQKPCFAGFCCNNIVDRIRGGYQYGLGFEEISGVQMHLEEKFDINGYALDPRLKDYIKKNLYLQPEEFNYNNINYTWI